jgi:putative membrane protein
MWGYSTGYGVGGMIWPTLGMLLCLALFALLIWGLLSLLEGRRHSSQVGGPAPSALETLRRRYTRGEIDEPTFQRMSERLTAHGHVNP